MKSNDNPVEDMLIHPLFPTPVGVFKFDKHINKKEMQFILNQETYNNSGNSTSTNTYILTSSEELMRIRKFLFNSAKCFFKNVYKHKDDVELYMTQSWCNYTKQGQFHHIHAHPNSFISGVFYVDGNEESDKIIFVRDIGYQQIKIFPTEYNAFNSESWWLPATPGTLYLFHSSLSHRVDPVQGEKTRISISFNTFLKGTIGSTDTLTELKTHKLG